MKLLTGTCALRTAHCVLALALAGCTPLVDSLARGDAKRPPKYEAKTATYFGDWFTEPGSCVLTGNSPEVKTTTGGQLSGGTIELRIFFAAPLAGRPTAAFSRYAVALNLEGAGQTYTLSLPYTPPDVANYIQPDNFLTIRYQPAQINEPLEVNFGTAGLVSGITYLARTCR